MTEWLMNFVNTYVVQFAINLVLAVLILIIGFAVIKALVKNIKKVKGFQKIDVNAQSFLVNFISILLKAVVILTAVIVLGVPESSVVAILGSCGLAIGLALQGGLSNIAAGVIIVLCKPFHVGDFIISGDLMGVVKDIGIYYTLVTTPDNQDVHVPNGTIVNSTIANLSTEETRRIDFDFKVAYDSDIDLVRKVLLASASMNDMTLKDPAPQVYVSEHAESGLTVKLRVWVAAENYWTLYFDMYEDVKKAFDKFNIEIPYNHLNVTIDNK